MARGDPGSQHQAGVTREFCFGSVSDTTACPRRRQLSPKAGIVPNGGNAGVHRGRWPGGPARRSPRPGAFSFSNFTHS
jgi:hypothetical protein